MRKVVLLDSLEGPDEDPLAGSWAKDTGFPTGQILAKRYTGFSGPPWNSAFWSLTEFTEPAVAVQLVGYPSARASIWNRLMACGKAVSGETSSKGYEVAWEREESGATFFFVLMRDGAELAKVEGVTLVSGDWIGLDVLGGIVSVWHKSASAWAEVVSVADSTYRVGFVGIGSSATDGSSEPHGLRNFSVGTEAAEAEAEAKLREKLMAANDLDFELLPADDEGLSPADDLAGAVAAAVPGPGTITPEAEEAPEPFGRSWVFDFEVGKFIRAGISPVPTNGFTALQQWVLMVAHTARYAHAVFSDDFGMEGPDDGIGELIAGEMVSDYEQRLREALLVHDRITALQNFKASYNPIEGVLFISYFEVVTDEEEVVPVTDVTLGRSELAAVA